MRKIQLSIPAVKSLRCMMRFRRASRSGKCSTAKEGNMEHALFARSVFSFPKQKKIDLHASESVPPESKKQKGKKRKGDLQLQKAKRQRA